VARRAHPRVNTEHRMNKLRIGIQILVVDDSPVSRKVLEHALSDEPYTLLFAESGEEALQLFQERRPAVVITDWMLPDSSGPELCQRIRSDAQNSLHHLTDQHDGKRQRGERTGCGSG
jgi:CheY-like chemotaxis protein